MKVVMQVGSVGVKLDGITMAPRDVRRLLRLCASIAAEQDDTPEPEPEPERAPVGFSAPVLERLPDELADEPG